MTYKRHPIEKLVAIGQAWGPALRELGLTATEDLLLGKRAWLESIIGRIDGFPVARLPELQSQAILLQLDGLNGLQADVLYRAGWRGLLGFAAAEPAALVQLIQQAIAEGAALREIDVKTAFKWQKRAVKLAHTCHVAGAVVTEGNPVKGATVYCDEEQAVTDSQGRFWIPGVPAGRREVIVRAEGFKRAKTVVTLSPEAASFYKITVVPGQDREEITDEAAGGWVQRFEADDHLMFVDTTLESLADNTPLHLRYRYKNGKVRFNGVFRSRRGQRIEIPRIVVSGKGIDPEAPIGTMFYWREGRLEKSEETLEDLRRRLAFGR